MLILLIIVLLLFGGGGYYGYNRFGGVSYAPVGLILLIVVVMWLLGSLRF